MSKDASLSLSGVFKRVVTKANEIVSTFSKPSSQINDNELFIDSLHSSFLCMTLDYGEENQKILKETVESVEQKLNSKYDHLKQSNIDLKATLSRQSFNLLHISKNGERSISQNISNDIEVIYAKMAKFGPRLKGIKEEIDQINLENDNLKEKIQNQPKIVPKNQNVEILSKSIKNMNNKFKDNEKQNLNIQRNHTILLNKEKQEIDRLKLEIDALDKQIASFESRIGLMSNYSRDSKGTTIKNTAKPMMTSISNVHQNIFNKNPNQGNKRNDAKKPNVINQAQQKLGISSPRRFPKRQRIIFKKPTKKPLQPLNSESEYIQSVKTNQNNEISQKNDNDNLNINNIMSELGKDLTNFDQDHENNVISEIKLNPSDNEIHMEHLKIPGNDLDGENQYNENENENEKENKNKTHEDEQQKTEIKDTSSDDEDDEEMKKDDEESNKKDDKNEDYPESSSDNENDEKDESQNDDVNDKAEDDDHENQDTENETESESESDASEEMKNDREPISIVNSVVKIDYKASDEIIHGPGERLCSSDIILRSREVPKFHISAPRPASLICSLQNHRQNPIASTGYEESSASASMNDYSSQTPSFSENSQESDDESILENLSEEEENGEESDNEKDEIGDGICHKIINRDFLHINDNKDSEESDDESQNENNNDESYQRKSEFIYKSITNMENDQSNENYSLKDNNLPRDSLNAKIENFSKNTDIVNNSSDIESNSVDSVSNCAVINSERDVSLLESQGSESQSTFTEVESKNDVESDSASTFEFKNSFNQEITEGKSFNIEETATEVIHKSSNGSKNSKGSNKMKIMEPKLMKIETIDGSSGSESCFKIESFHVADRAPRRKRSVNKM
ncbi:hypothetical protein TRFO_29916 [Tritrichomonas foetus]|uniref:Uncharacterized protein n=1 Tax=Tritrichomonas foetus TaxID=1144522 RepID=A0A1J4JZ90_9EUKA|nr:hypothetical protein TRFO_29916 [Tritrichomonas foetus]|eukprot:OHT02844.1 hypothetical protein TRFO_29916 [Tritrichomonas foetus]